MCQNICVRDRPTEAVENIYNIIDIYVPEIVLRGYIEHIYICARDRPKRLYKA